MGPVDGQAGGRGGTVEDVNPQAAQRGHGRPPPCHSVCEEWQVQADGDTDSSTLLSCGRREGFISGQRWTHEQTLFIR